MAHPPDKQPVAVLLESLFNQFNRGLFHENLTCPTFTVQIEKKSVLRFIPESYSIVVGKGFSAATINEILHELLHEMVHVWNYTTDQIDCTSNQYHNMLFQKAANDIGLYVKKHKTRGWATTGFNSFGGGKDERKPTAQAMQRRRRILDSLTYDPDLLDQVQVSLKKLSDTKKPAKVCFLKYVCSCSPPHNSIRSGRRPDGRHPINALCLNCREPYRLEEGQIEDHKGN